MSEQAFPQNEEYGRITQEAIDRIRARTGKRYPIEHPFVRHVNRDSINHVARAIGDDNPLWNDPEHARQSRYGKLVAPPALLYAAAWGSWDLRRGQGLPGVHGLHSSDRWIYYRPLLEGSGWLIFDLIFGSLIVGPFFGAIAGAAGVLWVRRFPPPPPPE